MNNKMKMYL